MRMHLAYMALESSSDDESYFTAFSAVNDRFQMSCIIWVVTFPWGESYVFQDVLN